MPKKTSMKYNRGVRLTEHRREIFLKHYRKTGLLWVSADAAGVSGFTVKLHMKEDEDFRERVEEALSHYRDTIEQEIHRRGIEGVDEPVFHQGIRVALVRKYSDRMLELHAKRHIQAYRDKVTADVNMTGGVLVVPSRPDTEDEWLNKHSQKENG
jgi:hypothetical protein